MSIIRTEPANASGANPVNHHISAAGPPLPVALRVVSGGHVTINNSSSETILVEVKKDQPEEADGTIQVFVYDLHLIKKSPVYRVNPSDKVFTLKYQICERELFQRHRQRLSVDGRNLDDLRSFSVEGIYNNSVIKLSLV